MVSGWLPTLLHAQNNQNYIYRMQSIELYDERKPLNKHNIAILHVQNVQRV